MNNQTSFDKALEKLDKFKYQLIWCDLASEVFTDDLTDCEKEQLEYINDSKEISPF